MTIIKQVTTEQVTTEIDTDDFTRADWKEFIIKYVSHGEILRTKASDIFWFEKLKERAIVCAQNNVLTDF